METIPVVLYYNGIWENETKYSAFKVTGVVVGSGITLYELQKNVASKIHLSDGKALNMKFQLREDVPPVDIDDDSTLTFYFDMCRKNGDYGKYPLLVTQSRNMNIELQHYTGASPLLDGNDNRYVNRETAIIPLVSQNISNISDYASDVANKILNDVVSMPLRGEFGEENENDIVRDPNNAILKKNQLFIDKKTLKIAMSLHSIRQNRQHKVRRSCPKEYVIVCNDNENCNWSVKASSFGKSGMFKIREVNDCHTCSLDTLMGHHRQVTSEIVSECISNRVINPKKKYTPADIIDDMLNDFNVSMTYQKAWRSKEKALEKMRGSPHNYSSIPSWLHMMEKTNPGTKTGLVLDVDGRFRYLFFALGPSIEAWKHCFPIIVIDGTFLKSTYRGTLLTASTQDANRSIIPIAFGVVETESEESWTWFIRQLRDATDVRPAKCIISDRHPGIIKGLDTVYPEVMHGACTFHVLKNIKTHFKKSGDELKQAYNGLCRAYTIEEFNRYMLALDKIDTRIREYLVKEVKLEKCTRIHGKTSRYATMTSNIAESLNHAMKELRDLPIETMIESIRSLVQKWYCKNKMVAETTHTMLSTHAENKLRNIINASKRLKVETSTRVVYAVYDLTTQFIVDLSKKTCSCEEFQYLEMPCVHVAAVLDKLHLSCYDYCSSFYLKKTLVDTYASSINPLGDKNRWNVPDDVLQLKVLPPNTKRPPGRPKCTRYKSSLEKKNSNRCGRCRGKNHNRKNCTNPIDLYM